MSEQSIADLFQIKTRFLRSAHLERDFDDPDAFSGYVPTDFTRSCFSRIVEGLKPRSGQRAWRMTGDYGSGKSSFALLLAHSLAKHESLPPQIRKVVEFRQHGILRPEFVPILVTCSRQSLATSILKALHRSISRIYRLGVRAKLAREIQRLLKNSQEPSDDQVIEMILKANSRLIAESKGSGLLLIVDELGKFLEFAALHPQQHDVFLLQRLADLACRSGSEPLLMVCLLHQGFNEYAEQLNPSAQREWEKVAGRFEEIVFDQPIEQVGGLIASAINVRTDSIPKSLAAGLKHSMEQMIKLGWIGASAADSLVDTLPRLFPLHPTVLPVLIRTFRRFGQNERSLFSFLLSNEPFGLRMFAEQQSLQDAHLFRLHHLYDYMRTNFGHRLSVLSHRSHWNLIDSVVESFATEEELHIKILKTVGMLNLLNETDLLATEDSVLCALADDNDVVQQQVRTALEQLRNGKRVLYERGRARGLCLWPHTSVDIEKVCGEARRAVPAPQTVAELIGDYLETRPIVARRHYIETGNLRHFNVRYCPVADLPGLLPTDATNADGLIIVPLCETIAERETAMRFAYESQVADRSDWLIAVPQPLSSLAALVQELQRWEWVFANTPELNADKYAREEVSRRKEAARSHLEKRVQGMVGLKQFTGHTTLDWFYRGHSLKIKDGRHLLKQLSCIFDESYPSAPRIHNELVNRRNLSSAAAAARMRLIERMFTHRSAEFLGMDSRRKPPEMSMYLSVLRNTGLHQPHGTLWRIGEPHHRSDKCQVLPALRRMREIVQKEADRRVNIAVLFDHLRKPPYGLRDGLIPVLLTVFAIAHEKDVAFYKEGTFLRELNGEAMLVLTKSPERFDIQYCKIEGVRAELFETLLTVLEVEPSKDREVELLDVVKNLCVFVAQLPAYVLNTGNLSSTALAVRDTILSAREPVKLLFIDLPKACGFAPMVVDADAGKPVLAFVKTLKAALDDLRTAYPLLQERLRKELRAAFDSPGSFQEFRITLATRAKHILLAVSEPKLRAFCLRLVDDNLPESDWLESLGSYLALKPPSKWHDAEEHAFGAELVQCATRFHRVESIVFSASRSPKNATGVRLAITQANGIEYERVVHFTADEEDLLRNLQMRFEALLTDDRRLGLVAASLAIWMNLERETSHE